MGNELENGSANATIVSFHVGKPREIAHGSKQVLSAIFKDASTAVHHVSATGVEGDAQGDTENHGGPDKAICVYLQSSYSYWQQLGRALAPGSFGENMTLSSWTEDSVNIGDIYRVGSLVVQVSQPRQPCFKLGIRNQWPELVQLSRESGYTGFYLRVLEEGEVGTGMEFIPVSRAQHSMSIFEANRIMYGKASTLEQYEQLASIPELADVWKQSIHRKIERLK
ncbi:hypothetical protein J40TS1_05070 [Paenibacillus montaniterrae]|uniref:MOSC domain-containing protein n=1 Tax=Paenibacillus montaniterrae TaxID=429341 RepID=A0A919YK08_9BACL|nr:MOSC domain-containing protein [Paenibacillus montaniterrae]GIP14865.1 hypothetical protein J40TS1_05070 [Paenibacillus montaniterrae]